MPIDVSRRTFVVIGTAIVLYAAAVRAVLMASSDLWIDEAFSFLYAQVSTAELITTVSMEATAPLYYLFVKAAFFVAGPTPETLRGLSAVLSVALVISVLAVPISQSLRSGRVVAAFIVAAHPFAVYYGSEGRQYATMWLITFWLLVCLDRAAQSPRAIVAAALLQVCALYVHNYGMFLLPLWIVAFLANRERGVRLKLVAAGGGALALWAPWALLFVPGQVRMLSNGSFLVSAWDGLGPLGVLAASVSSLLNVPPFPSYLRTLALVDARADAWLGAAVVLALIVFAAADAFARRLPMRGMLIVAIVSCVVAPYLVALVYRPIYLAGRYEMTALVPLALLAGGGVDALLARVHGQRRASVGVALLAACCILVAVAAARSTEDMLDEPPLYQYSPLAAAVAARGANTDANADVIVLGLDYAPVKAALMARGVDGARVHAFPPDVERHPGNWSAQQTDATVTADASAFWRRAPKGVIVVLPTRLPREASLTMEAFINAANASGVTLTVFYEGGRVNAYEATRAQ